VGKRLNIKVDESSNMQNRKVSDFQFQIVISRPFQKTMEKLRNQQLKKRIYECMSALARGFREWRSLSAKKIDVGDPSRSVRSIRVNDQMRVLFEGPIETKRFGLILFIHDVGNHDEYVRAIKRIARADLGECEFPEIELTEEEMTHGSKGIESSTAVFSKLIPIKTLLNPERTDAILSSTKANLLLTQRQMEVLGADRPLLIHGQAGSGKTTLLCHRLALSVLSRRTPPPARFVFLSYNEKLVKQAEIDTKEILREQHNSTESLEGVDFMPLQVFLKRYVPNPGRFEIDHYVPFGRFKQYYEIYRRGNPVAKRIPSEVAWHGIRSILKGACIPPSRPPLSRTAYMGLARRRRDFPNDMFDDVYDVGEWYQREVIQERGLWDDQDLAWTALDWVTTEKERNESMLLYDEIFCDEGQDLTEIEFRLLVSLCKQPMVGAQEGLQLAFAGDPLQTINPTGFRWSIIGNEVYRVQDRPVRLQQLQENFRSDYRIVAFANYIQDVRSHYMGQSVVAQEAFEKDGDIPQMITADTKEEVSITQKKLGELPPESAVIVWPDENDEVLRLYQTEDMLSKVDPKLDLYSISEAKGLEFRLVVLYKFASSPEVLKWKDFLVEKKTLPLEDEIPLLYFLNRLYVAVTRAKSFLVIVDTKSGVDNFWSIWKNALYFLPRSEVRSLVDSHPAFQGEVSDAAWRQWAETLFEHAERTRDLRLYERARRAYEKANEIQNVKRIDARVMEIAEQWEKAGKLYSDMNEFESARSCYDKAEIWEEAYKASTMLPTTPETKRLMAIYKFRMNIKIGKSNATAEFYDYALMDDEIDRSYLDELGIALLQAGDNARAAQVFLRIAQRFGDKVALVQAANSFFRVGNFEEAERLFTEAGETRSREYHLSRAENFMQKGDSMRAAQLFFENDAPEKVVAIFEWVEREKTIQPRGQLLEWAAGSYFKLERLGKALLAYKTLRSEPERAEDTRILYRIAECLEKLDEKPEAYEYYREARSYKKAADLAKELGRPQEEILSLKIEEGSEKGDFEGAVKLAEELGDIRLVHALEGHRFRHKREYRNAIPEFVRAEEWDEALDSIVRANLTYEELYIQWCAVLLAVAKSQKILDKPEKSQLVVVIRQVLEDPIWENHVPPSDMGLAYEKCASFAEAALYYESKFPEQWARDGWIRVKTAHRDFYNQRREFERAGRIESEILHRKTSEESQPSEG
jgi:tetratricopeptide (TPR) repeat protein